MLITEGEVAIILVLFINKSKLTPAEYPGILVGVRGKITIEQDDRGLAGVG
jgi:hypothetical protein